MLGKFKLNIVREGHRGEVGWFQILVRFSGYTWMCIEWSPLAMYYIPKFFKYILTLMPWTGKLVIMSTNLIKYYHNLDIDIKISHWTCPVVMIKYPSTGILREKGSILSHFQDTVCYDGGQSGRNMREMITYPHSGSKERRVYTAAQPYLHYCSLGSQLSTTVHYSHLN